MEPLSVAVHSVGHLGKVSSGQVRHASPHCSTVQTQTLIPRT